MKLPKSFLKPLRATRNGFFRRRRSRSGSIRGGASFSGPPADNPEPSSPKVTCIGQVRVKSKRRGSHSRRSVSQRRTGEASFRRTAAEQLQEERKSRRWVHLRAFGSELACLLFPCAGGGCRRHKCRIFKSGCCCNDGDCNGGEEIGGCGVFMRRCLVCGGRRGEIFAAAGGGEAAAEEEEGKSGRRHVFDDIEVRNGRIEVKGRSLEVEEEDERWRTGICVPPKNALLLMRCRSDPTKMAALVNRYSNLEYRNRDDIEEDEDDDEDEAEENSSWEGGDLVFEKVVFEDKGEAFEQCTKVSSKIDEEEEIRNEVRHELESNFEEKFKLLNVGGEQEEEIKATDEQEEEIDAKDEESEETESNMSSFEALLDQENSDSYLEKVEENEDNEEYEDIGSRKIQEPGKSNELENNREEEDEEQSKQVLPDCLLLMMCEPKLSMEVCKETWVRGADFVRRSPKAAAAAGGGCERHQDRGRQPAGADPKPRKQIPAPPSGRSDGTRRQMLQPARSSCSLPAATMGPLALTRCKSEPRRTAADKLAHETAPWKDGGGGVKMEVHGPAGVGS
ncbi:peptidyl-prolyl cis-trans isomerases [Striga asiatica]|uniref:Peptidyl-prolyl cis-trans isomerases n=1 Tax=Striga asiatica TaxID=4170 RepID=A0A5A7P8U5_STRAF|nr:peptidyl-prolyl cis-trans isomerases [Striga asiatica]